MSAKQNRKDMPETAKIVDEFRRVFGPVKVKWCTENGKTLGKKPE
jgi:hypothetical protein